MAQFRPQSTYKVLVMMSDIFNKTKIPSRKKVGNTVTLEDITLPIKLASAERLITKISSPDETRIFMPVIGMQITSLDFDEERAKPPLNTIISADNTQFVLQPVPYNYTIDVSILARRESTLYDVIESIVPKYKKWRAYPMVSFKFTDGSKIVDDNVVELQATPIEVVNVDLSREDEQAFQATMSFLVKSWVYGANPSLGSGLITQEDIDATGGEFNKRQLGKDKTIGGETPLKDIRTIDITFENTIGAIIDNMSISENTGGDIETTITPGVG